MRVAQLTVMAVAALATFGAGATLTAQPRRAPPTAPLFPLSERDLTATQESGCECSFNVGRNALMRVIGNELTLRTRAGRQVCRISDDQFSRLSDGSGSAVCGGVRISLRRTGAVRAMPESDSADWRSTLTIGQGRARRTLSGRYGCAC